MSVDAALLPCCYDEISVHHSSTLYSEALLWPPWLQPAAGARCNTAARLGALGTASAGATGQHGLLPHQRKQCELSWAKLSSTSYTQLAGHRALPFACNACLCPPAHLLLAFLGHSRFSESDLYNVGCPVLWPNGLH